MWTVSMLRNSAESAIIVENDGQKVAAVIAHFDDKRATVSEWVKGHRPAVEEAASQYYPTLKIKWEVSR